MASDPSTADGLDHARWTRHLAVEMDDGALMRRALDAATVGIRHGSGPLGFEVAAILHARGATYVPDVERAAAIACLRS